MWQVDITHWQLAEGEHAEILNVIDDHSRLFICSHAYGYVKAGDVVESFHRAAELHGLPAALLSDNGAVFTGTARHGKVALQTELERLGVAAKNSRPYHPQTCGKIERLHQTLKRYLDAQQSAATLSDLQAQLDAFVHYYNHIRPHRASQAAHRYRPTAVASKPSPPASRRTATSGSAKTRSTRPARSACGTSAGSTKSASDEPTKASRSSSSSPT